MGVQMAKIIVKEETNLEALANKAFAVDGNNSLYQFLALIRTKDGTPLKDSQGNVTSHLVGLSMRMTKLISDYGMKLIYVFDGAPPVFKAKEIVQRREIRDKAIKEWQKAVAEGDYETARKKATASSRLSRTMVEDAKILLNHLGIPWIQAPSEGEAQAAYLARKKEVWAINSRDFDSLLFGAPRLARYLTISGRSRWGKLIPEIIELDKVLQHNEISHKQLIDAAILIGTDFNDGIKGIGPIKAIQTIKKYKTLDKVPDNIKSGLPSYVNEIREFFLNPPVVDNYSITSNQVNEEELREFLCEEHDFSPNKVDQLIERMTEKPLKKAKVRSLDSFFKT
ncbi:MAG: flap endonuclease-1 [Promethearchaeota archaeon]